jgi:hypothetical protein
MNDDADPTPTPASPTPPPVLPEEARWHTPIGIVAIIFGAFGLVAGIGGIAAKAMVRASLSSQLKSGPEATQQIDAFLEKWSTFMIGGGLVIAVLAIILLGGGIFTLKKRLVGPRMLVIWSVLKILFGTGYAIMGQSMQKDQFAIMFGPHSQMGEMGDQISAFVQASARAGIVFNILWTSILPVFLLIWFSRKKIKSNIAHWS